MTDTRYRYRVDYRSGSGAMGFHRVWARDADAALAVFLRKCADHGVGLFSGICVDPNWDAARVNGRVLSRDDKRLARAREDELPKVMVGVD